MYISYCDDKIGFPRPGHILTKWIHPFKLCSKILNLFKYLLRYVGIGILMKVFRCTVHKFKYVIHCKFNSISVKITYFITKMFYYNQKKLQILYEFYVNIKILL